MSSHIELAYYRLHMHVLSHVCCFKASALLCAQPCEFVGIARSHKTCMQKPMHACFCYKKMHGGTHLYTEMSEHAPWSTICE
jgi:hypothetical protein